MKHPSQSIQFERRDILKLIAGLPGAALISRAPLASAAAIAVPGPSASPTSPSAYQPKIFNPHEWNTIHVLCDLMIPADQISASASQVGVPQFIDDWLDFKRGNLPAQVQGGLTWLDRECGRSFNRDFIDCTSAEQKQILDRIAYPQKAAPGDANAVAFFNCLRDLVVSGFFTSEAGIRDLPYLGNEPQSEWNGCSNEVLAKLGLAEDEGTT